MLTSQISGDYIDGDGCHVTLFTWQHSQWSEVGKGQEVSVGYLTISKPLNQSIWNFTQLILSAIIIAIRLVAALHHNRDM